MSDALLIVLSLLGIAVALVVNYAIWFIMVPMAFRVLRDQHRRRRARKISN